MSTQEKNTKAKKSYDEAIRFMGNARKELGLAKKHGKYYEDVKHVSGACGIAYKGVLVALDGIFILKGIDRDTKKRASIEFYETNLSKIDNKMLHSLNDCYKILHLSGYYDCNNNAKVILEGFEQADSILKKLEKML